MADLDYTIVGKTIAKTLANGNAPLSDEQYVLLQGALSLYLLKIEMHGLEALIKNLKKQRK